MITHIKAFFEPVYVFQELFSMAPPLIRLFRECAVISVVALRAVSPLLCGFSRWQLLIAQVAVAGLLIMPIPQMLSDGLVISVIAS